MGPSSNFVMSLPARRAVVAAFGERGLRLDARAASLLADHVSDAAEAKGGDAGGAALAALLAAYEPGQDERSVWSGRV